VTTTAKTRRLLLVDDDEFFAAQLSRFLQQEGFATTVVATARAAYAEIEQGAFDLVVLDLLLPDAWGAAVLAHLKSQRRDVPCLVLTGYGSIESAVELVRAGAFDYVSKPCEPAAILERIRAALDEQERPPAPAPRASTAHRPRAMDHVWSLAARAATQESHLLLLGETGVGKDHLARWIHAHSRRHAGPFVTVNCAALPQELIEAELFGCEPGAYTGAQARRAGCFEAAAGGSIMLNEIGDMPLLAQTRLLTVLDLGVVQRLGGGKPTPLDARIMAASNSDLQRLVAEGRFRRDLYYRLAVIAIEVPPLRRRRDELADLAGELLAQLSLALGLPSPAALEPAALRLLEDYAWPGNIRELRNVLERALVASGTTRIRAQDLGFPGAATPAPTRTASAGRLRETCDVVARDLVRRALEEGGSQQRAADLLGLSRHALARQIRRLVRAGLDPREPPAAPGRAALTGRPRCDE
jgi:DNA-binding NtrC family response regulator